jgi:hypothetical protein
MSLSLDQAKEVLATGSHSINSLFDLVRNVSASVDGASASSTYLLYSGTMPGGITFASQVARHIKNVSRAVDVVSPPVGELLISVEFTDALKGAVKLEVLGDINKVPDPDQELEMTKLYNLMLNGKDGPAPTSPRISNANSLWDIASKNYV